MKFISFSELQSKSVHLSVYSQLLQYKSVKSLAFNSFDFALLWRNLQKKETFRWSSILNQTAFDEKRRKGNPFSN